MTVMQGEYTERDMVLGVPAALSVQEMAPEEQTRLTGEMVTYLALSTVDEVLEAADRVDQLYAFTSTVRGKRLPLRPSDVDVFGKAVVAVLEKLGTDETKAMSGRLQQGRKVVGSQTGYKSPSFT